MLSLGYLSSARAQETDLSEVLLKNLEKSSEGKHQMMWYRLVSNSKIEIGQVTTQHQMETGRLTVITKVKMPNEPKVWVDSTVCDLPNFRPIYHTSENVQRSMRLSFDDPIIAEYTDLLKKTHITDTLEISGSFIDSNLYPFLIPLLPMEEGFSTTFRTFDYNPDRGGSLIRYLDVRVRGSLPKPTGKEGEVVYLVDVLDREMPDVKIEYHVDPINRELFFQRVTLPNGVMCMEKMD